MFGIICAGRPVDWNLQQIDVNKYAFQIKDGAKVNHMVVFLLPDAVIPPGMAASVYFQLPGKDFQLLGALTSVKPSAIFKINNNHKSTATYDLEDSMMEDTSIVEQFDITIGISIEPLEVVENLLVSQRESRSGGGNTSTTSNPQNVAMLANKIVQNAYNFLSGFTGPDGRVPMKAFDDWWNKFKSRINSNPNYLDTLD